MNGKYQRVMILDHVISELHAYFGSELETLTPRELAALCFDATGLGLVTISEYQRSIGSGNLKSYAGCLTAGQSRDSAWLSAMLDKHGHCAL